MRLRLNFRGEVQGVGFRFYMQRKARELGVHYLDLAAAEMTKFDADMDALGIIPCWSEPRATSAAARARR